MAKFSYQLNPSVTRFRIFSSLNNENKRRFGFKLGFLLAVSIKQTLCQIEYSCRNFWTERNFELETKMWILSSPLRLEISKKKQSVNIGPNGGYLSLNVRCNFYRKFFWKLLGSVFWTKLIIGFFSYYHIFRHFWTIKKPLN